MAAVDSQESFRRQPELLPSGAHSPVVSLAAWQTDFSAGGPGDVGPLPMEISYSQRVFFPFPPFHCGSNFEL